MRMLNNMLNEIRSFNGESFTLIDVECFHYSKSYMKKLVADGEVIILPERTADGKAIYRHTPDGDYVTRMRLAERRSFHTRCPTCPILPGQVR